MKKFEAPDISYAVITAHPQGKFFVYNGLVYVNNTTEQSIKLNTFLPEPPPPPPPTEAPPLTISNTYVDPIEYDIYPIDASAYSSGNMYILLSADPALYSGVQVIFRRDDSVTAVSVYLYDYGSPSPGGPYLISVGGSKTLTSNGTNWV